MGMFGVVCETTGRIPTDTIPVQENLVDLRNENYHKLYKGWQQ